MPAIAKYVSFPLIKHTLFELEFDEVYYKDLIKDITVAQALCLLTREIRNRIGMNTGNIPYSIDIFRVLVSHWYITSEVLPQHSKSLEAFASKRGYTREALIQEARYDGAEDLMVSMIANHEKRGG